MQNNNSGLPVYIQKKIRVYYYDKTESTSEAKNIRFRKPFLLKKARNHL